MKKTIQNKTTEDKKLELLFILYSLGRKIKSLSKSGNSDKTLEVIILQNLLEKDMDVTQLSGLICANLSSVSESVEKLVKAGLIQKITGKDRRYFFIHLTKKGKETLNVIKLIMRQHCIKGFSKLSDEETVNLINTLNKISF